MSIYLYISIDITQIIRTNKTHDSSVCILKKEASRNNLTSYHENPNKTRWGKGNATWTNPCDHKNKNAPAAFADPTPVFENMNRNKTKSQVVCEYKVDLSTPRSTWRRLNYVNNPHEIIDNGHIKQDIHVKNV